MQTASNAFAPQESPPLSAVAVKAAVRVIQAWGLNAAEAASLLDVSERTFARMKAGTYVGELRQDQLSRASALIGLYKALHLYFGDDLADRWPSMPNKGPLFDGRSPVVHMQAGGLPALLDVRGYVDAIRGGM